MPIDSSIEYGVKTFTNHIRMCIYMPIDSISVAVLDERLKEDVLSFKEKGNVLSLGDFNARVGKVADDDAVIGTFREGMCNASGNKLISLLHEVELVTLNIW